MLNETAFADVMQTPYQDVQGTLWAIFEVSEGGKDGQYKAGKDQEEAEREREREREGERERGGGRETGQKTC